jgi:hypothetical protein
MIKRARAHRCEEYRQQTQEKLTRLWKADFPTRLVEAQRLLREIDARHDGQITRYLEATGLGDSFTLIASLGEIARRRYAGKA